MDETWFRDPRYAAGLEELAELQREESRLYARRARVLAGLAARTSREGWQGDAPLDSLLLDVAGTCVLGQVAAGSRLLADEHLVVRLPLTLEALDHGVLAAHQAQVIVGETRDLDPEVVLEVERRVLPVAPPLCPADLRRLVRRTVLEVDAAEQERREQQAVQRRRVWVRPVEDGMALLCALLPADQAQRAYAGLTESARAARREPGEERSTDELRADLLAGILAGGVAPGSSRPLQVVVHVPLAVALGLSDAPADLSGHGPVSAAQARRVLDGPVQLRRALADPETGEVWALDGQATRLGPSVGPSSTDPQPAATVTGEVVVDHGASSGRSGVQALPAWASGVPQPPPTAERLSGPPPGPATTPGLATTADASPDSGFATTPGLATTADAWPNSGFATTPGLATTADAATDCASAPDSGPATTAGPEPTSRPAAAPDQQPGPRPALRAALLTLLHAPVPAPLPPEPQHDPSAPLARLVRARDVRCDGIGCSVPSSRCELDHLDPWPEGETSADNLRPRSQRCHHAKHTGWSVDVQPDGSRWTSPSGRGYLVPRRGIARPPDVDLALAGRPADPP